MFKIFKKKSKIDQLNEKLKSLQEEIFHLSRVDRKKSDLKYAESLELIKQIEELEAVRKN